MALNDQETLLVYQYLNRVFKEDLHISRPLVQMLRHMGHDREASECAFLTARRMLATHQPGSALGFLEICRQIGHPGESEINNLMVIAELTGEDSEPAESHLFPLVEQLSDQESLAFIRHGSLHRLTAGTNVLVQGEVSDSFYLILAGHVHIHMQVDGRYFDLNQLHAGEFFGEFASVYHLPRSATATALTPALLLELSEQDIRHLMELSPLAGEYLIDIVKRRMVHSMSRSHPALSAIAPVDRDWLAEQSHVIEFPAGVTIHRHDLPEGHCAIVFIGSLNDSEHNTMLNIHDLFACPEQPFPALTALERTFIYCFPTEVFHSFRNAYVDFDNWAKAYMGEAAMDDIPSALD